MVLRVSVLELPARWSAIDEALADVDALLSEAPTDLAILPEMALVGYVSPDGDFDLSPFAEPLHGPTVTRAAELAASHRTHLVIPLVLTEEGQLFNAAIVLDPTGRVLATYRKRHPWFPETWATAGPYEPPLFEASGVLATIAICYDGHFLFGDAAPILERADLLVFTSAWVDEEDSRIPLLRDLSERFGVSVANANWAPGEVWVPGQGGSCIIDAAGRIVASVDTSSAHPPRARRADAQIQRRSAR